MMALTIVYKQWFTAPCRKTTPTNNMAKLNPTLWRTCKMLAGIKRIQLLRQLYENPGNNVTEHGRAVGVKRSDASQELRRIQSRGLLKSTRIGRPLIYRMEPDPQVSSAAPILQAIQTAFSIYPPERDPDMCQISNGLAHERRIAIAWLLQKAPRSMSDLQTHLPLSPQGLEHHLIPLLKSGFVKQKKSSLYFQDLSHPLADALSRLLRKRPPSL